MENTQIIAWILQTAGGLLLLAVTALVNSMRGEFQRVREGQAKLQTDYAALSARVSSEREDTLRSLNRIEVSLRTISHKIDDLRDHRARGPEEEE